MVPKRAAPGLSTLWRLKDGGAVRQERLPRSPRRPRRSHWQESRRFGCDDGAWDVCLSRQIAHHRCRGPVRQQPLPSAEPTKDRSHAYVIRPHTISRHEGTDRGFRPHGEPGGRQVGPGHHQRPPRMGEQLKLFRRESDEERAARSIVFRRAAEPVRAFLYDARNKTAETARCTRFLPRARAHQTHRGGDDEK